MRRFIRFAAIFFVALFVFVPLVHAQSSQPPQTSYAKAKVLHISKQGSKTIEGIKNTYQTFTAQILDGKDKDKTLTIDSGYQSSLTPSQIVRERETVVLALTPTPNGLQYQVYDEYRVPTLIALIVVFFLVVLIVAQLKGIGSLLGLTISLAVILLYIVPQILHGADPLQTSIIGSLVILVVTTYLAHGVSKQTTVALISTFFALMLTVFFAQTFVNLAHLTGFNEAASNIQFGATSSISVRGLLLAGIVIGTLGALNDVTTSQAAAVFELAATDVKLRWSKLFQKGFSIGREHVVSMVNTLVLAYAGSSLALFLLLVLNTQKQPLWLIFNSEDISDELIRTLAGSMGLVLVVPIVTLIAALVCDRKVRETISDIFYALK